MSNSFDKYQKKRLQTSYLSVVISISLVLFLLGTLGYIVLKTNNVSEYFKEKVVMTVFLKDRIKKHDLEVFVAELKKEPHVKSTRYISKKVAAKKYSKEIGEDFVEFLGENPLKNAVDIHFKSDYVNEESMVKMKKKLLKRSIIYEITYDKSLVKFLTKNIQRVSFWLLILSAIFTLISVILINSSIRLSVYSKRFDIKTMQMVGATKKFIRKPFIIKSIQLGIISAVIAIIIIVLLITYLNQLFPTLNLLKGYKELTILLVGILLMGILISWISTFFATQRFLNLRTEELY